MIVYNQKLLGGRFKLLNVKLENINELKPHEEIIEPNLELLKKKILQKGIFEKPIIIAKQYKIILDGHHRWNLLKHVGAKKVPCVEIDYFSSHIQLDTWYLKISCNDSSYFEDFVRKNFKIEKDLPLITRKEKIFPHLDKNKLAIVDVIKKQTLILHGTKKQFMSLMCANCCKMELIEDVNVDLYFTYEDVKDHIYFVITKPLKKEEVIEHVLKGNVFPPKTTRHIISIDLPDCKYSLQELM